MKKNTRQLQVRAYTVVVNWGYRLQVSKHARQSKQLEIEHHRYPCAICPRSKGTRVRMSYRARHLAHQNPVIRCVAQHASCLCYRVCPRAA